MSDVVGEDHYGTLTVTISHLMSHCSGSEYESLDAYYKALGNPLPDEPVMVVRISKDGETRFLKEGQHDIKFEDDLRQNLGVVTVWELPEDEFWFYRAFRPGLFDLENDLPPFMYDMSIVNAFAMFVRLSFRYIVGVFPPAATSYGRSAKA